MIRRLSKSIREYAFMTWMTPVMMTGEVVCECFIPMLTASLINNIQSGCELSIIVKYGLGLTLMAILSLTFGCLAGVFCATASTGFAKNLRHDLFYKVQGYSFSNIDRFSTSSLVTRLTTDVNNVQMAFMMIIRIAVRSPLMLIFAFIMSIRVGRKLAWIFAGFIPFLGCALAYIIYKVMPLFRAVFKKYDKLNNSIQENIKGIRVVKSFVREEYEKEKFFAASDDVRKDFTHAEKILAFNHPIMQFCIFCSLILISFFASKLIITSHGSYINIGSLTSMITYSMQILMSLMMLSMIFVMLTLSSASAKRIAEVLDEENDLKNPEHPIMEVPNGSIDFENVSFQYSAKADKMTLAGINLHINAGMTVGIIGGTGSGKTSLIQLISRLYDVTEGSVKVGGIDVREYDLSALRDQVAVVLQKNILFSGSIKENLRWGNANASDEELVRICKLAQADEFISRFPDGYDSHIEQGGSNVSGGQKQRLCIARALLKKPKIMILDDSTSAVDTRTDALIRKAFKNEIPDTTKLIIAQRISSVEDADLILVMDNGKIHGMGTHSQLLANDAIYKEVYMLQNKVGETNE
ncbi:ABC transporter ATP-binding protein [[Clostridium] polysaccharolyticum]|uniref:ATP-binding cassette, subfamily B n=1 Tax=[Clostridium] polysaccharolyticum TaxID=29364 RepID=A0A1I0F0Q3_9FIRM|nr:ABC transporter ATP-binding protein [[Clostridium] polysaccharolyticum]SET50795.1 ATP-binding cassette, subfamily B [[Clostridium] polysaccharolyticum]